MVVVPYPYRVSDCRSRVTLIARSNTLTIIFSTMICIQQNPSCFTGSCERGHARRCDTPWSRNPNPADLEQEHLPQKILRRALAVAAGLAF